MLSKYLVHIDHENESDACEPYSWTYLAELTEEQVSELKKQLMLAKEEYWGYFEYSLEKIGCLSFEELKSQLIKNDTIPVLPDILKG